MSDLIVDLEQIRRDYESGQVSPPAVASSSRLTPAVTVPKQSRLRRSRVELILTVVTLAIAAAIYVPSSRTRKPPLTPGVKTDNSAAYHPYMRAKANVS